MDGPVVFEEGGHLYLAGPVVPMQPSEEEIAEYAFSQALRSQAPNEKILWLKGQYVEAERANRNGQYWSRDDISIKSLQPRLMPITVMHDPTTAVGVIADTKLLTPEADNVPRARIDTALAIWAHRFPEVAQEIAQNYEQGTLMQSMEADSSSYDCMECGKIFVKLPGGAERANWCDHLQEAAAANRAPVRRLRDVTFTGTGLIFGTRNGAVGALDTAHLDPFKAEVAEFHRESHTATPPKRTSKEPSVDKIEITKAEYDELRENASKATALAARVTTLETENASLTEQAGKVEKLEIDLKAATDAKTAVEGELSQLKETARAATLADERMSGLGDKFLEKLPESVKAKLGEQAKSLSDEDWTGRLSEIAEFTGVKPDEKSAPGAAGAPGASTTTETSASQLGSEGSPAPSAAAKSTVLTGLFRSTRPNQPAKK